MSVSSVLRIKQILLFLGTALLASCGGSSGGGGGSDCDNPTGTFTLVWSDEFDDLPDTTADWTYEFGDGCSNGICGWGNNEQQWYTNGDNVAIVNDSANDGAPTDNSYLQIQVREEPWNCYLGINGCPYTSTRMKTQGKREFRFGRIEARLRRDTTQRMGMWPAFWMLGSNITSVGWPACGEIDIVEQRNNEPTNYGTLHWLTNTHTFQGGSGTVNDVTQYHQYAIEWDCKSIAWFIDGVKFNELSITDPAMSEFRETFFIILNYAVGTDNTGFTGTGPDSNTQFPANMYVDYIRVYQRQ